MVRFIPNFITLLNAFSGCLAIVFLFKEDYNLLFAAFAACLLADFGDGLAARLLDVRSNVGKELDSMADMVPFGVLPGAILYTLISEHIGGWPEWSAYLGFIFTCAAALRLARFNLDTRQSENFLGLAVPAATLFVVGLLWIQTDYPSFWLFQPIFLILIAILLSALMLTELPMFSLKFKGFGWKENGIRYIFLIFAILMIVLLKSFALSGIIILYVVTSLFQFVTNKK